MICDNINGGTLCVVARLPIGTAVNQAEMILECGNAYSDIQEITKKSFFEEKMYGMDNINIREPIRTALKEYFG